MTREEAIDLLVHGEWIYSLSTGNKEMQELCEAISIVDTNFRPVSREQVEKMRGEGIQDERGQVMCSRCGSITAIGTKNALHNAKRYDRFCFCCGAPMTDEAVDIRLNELEALNDG